MQICLLFTRLVRLIAPQISRPAFVSANLRQSRHALRCLVLARSLSVLYVAISIGLPLFAFGCASDELGTLETHSAFSIDDWFSGDITRTEPWEAPDGALLTLYDWPHHLGLSAASGLKVKENKKKRPVWRIYVLRLIRRSKELLRAMKKYLPEFPWNL